MYVEETTHEERVIISNAVSGTMWAIDTALRVLLDLQEEYFGELPQKEISSYRAEHLGRVIWLTTNTIRDALSEYYVAVGEADGCGADYTMRSAKRAQTVFETEALLAQLEERERKASPEKRKGIEAARRALCDLPDDQAIPALRALLNN